MRQFVMAALLLLASGACFAQQYAIVAPFPVPRNLAVVRDGITLAEFAALRVALNADRALRDAQHGPPEYSPSQFGNLTVFPVDLGPLGHGMVVYFNRSGACGATANCPMALYIQRNGAYRPALHFGGWGFAIVPSPGAPPGVVSAWNMSCCDEIYARYHYSNGQFIADACVEELGSPDAYEGSKPLLKACEPGANQHTFTPPVDLHSPGPGASPTYNELQQLRAVAEPDVSKISSVPFRDLPVIALSHWLVLAVADRSRSTRLFVYPRMGSRIGPAVLRDIAGDDVAEVETEQREQSPLQMLAPAPALIIARRRGQRMDMTLYSEPGSDLGGGLPSGGKMGVDACEQVMPKSGAWPATWNPGVLRLHAVPCNAVAGASPVVSIDGTLVSNAEQDGSGQVWAVTSGFYGRLVRWDGQWQPTLGPFPNAMPQLGPGPDGGVLVDWRSGHSPQWLDGDTIRPFTEKTDFSTTLRLAGGGALLTRTPEIMHPTGEPAFRVTRWPALSILGKDGEEIAKYDVQANQFQPTPSDAKSPPCLAPFATLADRDTTWIWTPYWRDCLGLRGFLTTDGHSFNYVSEIGGLPDAQLSALGRWPGDRLAAAVPGDGVYLINPAAQTAQRLTPPAPEALRHVAAVFLAGNVGYVVEESDCKPAAGGQDCDPVWRWRKGEWQLVIPALDATPDVPCWILTPKYCVRHVAFTENARGVWVASVGSGLWVIPPSGDAKQFTSRTGFPLSTATQLFSLTDGSILAMDADHARTFAFRTSRNDGTH